MSKREYRKALNSARRDLERLLKQREAIDKRIVQLEPTIRHLQELCQDLDQRLAAEKAASTERLQGLTQEIRNTLMNHYQMSPRQVMEDLQKRGFDFKAYSNPLASVHTILKRLVKAGTVEVVPTGKGKKQYRWKVTILDAVLKLTELVAEAKKWQPTKVE